jgi:BirA family biotin operon repressor/biotin-[acetyl-CoA-carboxylase] ligase
MTDALRFEHVAEIDSTNAELMRRPFAGRALGPVALLADAQNAGRGRNGRPWFVDPAASLALSVAVERAADGAALLGLPLAIGVTLAEVLAAHGAVVMLKWPNDLLVASTAGPAKAGGILVEVRGQGPLQRVVAGCGLNLVSSPALQALQAGQPVAALFSAAAAPDRIGLARRLADALAAAIGRYADEGLQAYQSRWRALDALADTPIDVLRADGTRTPGVARGIDADGALLVSLADGTLERLVAGEVSVRRR